MLKKSIVLYPFRLDLAAYDLVANMQDFGMPKGIYGTCSIVLASPPPGFNWLWSSSQFLLFGF